MPAPPEPPPAPHPAGNQLGQAIATCAAEGMSPGEVRCVVEQAIKQLSWETEEAAKGG
jgi:hypothetical protein